MNGKGRTRERERGRGSCPNREERGEWRYLSYPDVMSDIRPRWVTVNVTLQVSTLEIDLRPMQLLQLPHNRKFIVFIPECLFDLCDFTILQLPILDP